jgi:hypothetical protein
MFIYWYWCFLCFWSCSFDGVFRAFGRALLMVFFFTLTKLTFFFLWWCLHGDGNRGNVNCHYIVHWFCCYSWPWLCPSINIFHCFGHALLLVFSWPLVVFFYWFFHGLDLFFCWCLLLIGLCSFINDLCGLGCIFYWCFLFALVIVFY